MPKIVYISWQPYCSRSDNTARELGGKSYMVYFGFFGSNYFTIIFKYFFQFVKTLWVLLKDRPDTVFVMSPPVFAAIPVYLYCKLFRAIYLIDAHSGALQNPMWDRVVFLQKFFSKRALFTIVTNKGITEKLENWEAPYKVIPDVVIKYDNPRIPDFGESKNITFVSTYSSDEPLEPFLEAMKNLTDVQAHVTGKINSFARGFLKIKPSNVQFTDFLRDTDYYGLLTASDLIVVLTTKDHTMQRGAYEAIYLGKPIVTSSWDVLHENFPIGAVFVENTADGIEEGIRKGFKDLGRLRKEADTLMKRKSLLWGRNKTDLLDAIQSKLN